MLKIGVLGAGHLGKIHINCILQIKELELVGFYDSDALVRAEISREYGIKSFNNFDDLMEQCELIDIVTPTLSHYECAKKSIEKGKHVFHITYLHSFHPHLYHKPVTHRFVLSEADRMQTLAHHFHFLSSNDM